MAVYSSAKSALLHYSLALDEELGHKNKDVRVLSVCPGPTESNFLIKIHRKNSEVLKNL